MKNETTANKTTVEDDPRSPDDVALQNDLKERGDIPRHIAVIMDGNGRWARDRGKSRVVGHHEGVESVRDITESCAQLGVDYLTLYTFSTENWNRPTKEVRALMRLLVHTIRRETETLRKNRIRLRAVGSLSMLPEDARRELNHAMDKTRDNDRMTLIMAISYSGRLEIVEAARELSRRVRDGELEPEDIDEALFSSTLMMAGIPDPDLLIRTGGEFRISNFLLWELAYTEMYITGCYWPAFRRRALYDAVRDYQNRERRFGRVLTAE
ncbi:MAG: isoprenyl transferase [Rhodothermales bacterium]